MKARLLFLVLGLFLGVGTGAILTKLTAPPPPPSGPSADEVAQLQDNLKAATVRVQEIEKVNAELAGELAKLKRTAAATAATNAEPSSVRGGGGFLSALFGSGSDTNRGNAMKKLMQAGMKQHVEGRVSALKLRLKLTPEQEQQVRDLLHRQMAQASEMTGKLFEGKLSKDEIAKAAPAGVDLRAELQNILSPEQWSEYEKYQTEQRQSRAQMMANVELSQLQNSLQLTTEQQDKVFNILYQHAEPQASQWTEGTMPNPANWQQDWQQREAGKAEALRAVLTPEQMQSYEKHQQAQQEMIKAVTDSMGLGAAGKRPTSPPTPASP